MLKQGIYEHIINQETDRKMQEAERSGLVCVQQPIDGAESPQMLANYLANAIRQKLEDIEIVDYKPTPIVESIAYRS